MQNDNKRTFAGAEQYAAENGIILSPSDRARITAVQTSELERQRLINPLSNSDTFADRFNRFFPRLLDAMLSAGDTLIAFVKTIILSAGIPFILLGLLIVEHHRVVQGIGLFDTDSTFAGIAAAVLVGANLVLEFLIHFTEHRAGYVPDVSRQWSLRLWWQHARYTLGIGDTWTPRQLSPAHRFYSLLRLVTFTILALALAGSMRDVIGSTPGAWHTALISIVTESDLLRMSTWLSGLLFAAAAVLTAQGLSRYVSVQTVEIVANMKARQTQAIPYATELDNAAANVVYAIVADKLAKQKAKTIQDITAPTPHQVADFLEVKVANGYHMNGNGTQHESA